MKIGIDVSQIVYKTGVSKYTEQLVKGLLRLDASNEYVLFAGTLRQKKSLQLFFDSLKGNFTEKLVGYWPPTIADTFWNKFQLFPIEKFTGKLNVFHSSDWSQPPTSAWRVTTIHDLSPVLYPDLTPKKTVAVHKRRLYLVKRQVDKIIVPSQTTKSDLVDLGFEKSKISVIYEAANHKKASPDQVEDVKRKYKIPGEYCLAVGVHPRKNTERIIKAFEKASAGKDLRLVIVGHPTENVSGGDRNLRFTGRVEEDGEMDALYTGASALIFPSLYEGFGIPILDAFACETPVVTSNKSSMSEIAGDAAVLVDPLSTEEITEGIVEALSKPKTYVGKGNKRLKEFSWDKMAQKTLEIYESFK